MSAVCLLVLLIPAVSAQTFHWGRCPTPKVQSNFSLPQYMGKWYEIEKLPAHFEMGKCIQANYSIGENGIVQVLNSQVLTHRNKNGSRWFIEGTAKVVDPQEPAKLGVKFASFTPYSPYWVLSTDYTGYSIVYSCTNIFRIFHFDFAWILSRSPTLPAVMVDFTKKLLIEEGIDISKMTHTDQSCISEV